MVDFDDDLSSFNMSWSTDSIQTTEKIPPVKFENQTMFLSSLGVLLSMPEWEAAITAVTLSLIILTTIVGNILVILSVFTYKPLRSPPNYIIASLAVADLTVALLVLPLNIAYYILGRWVLGKIVCEFWLTSDVLCCTSSLLHLSAISLDRYRAITDPIVYSKSRPTQVLLTICGVWVLSFLISSPPLLGWNDWPAEFKENTPCELTSERGYVIYSALGSFFIPCGIMIVVYIRIYFAIRRRLRQRAKSARPLSNHSRKEEEHPELSEAPLETQHDDEGIDEPRAIPLISLTPDQAKGGSEESVTDHEPSHSNFDNNGNNEGRERTSIPSHPQRERRRDRKTRNSNSHPQHVPTIVEEKQRISLSKERKAARTLGIIMVTFLVCWLPFFLMYSILPFCPSCVPPSKMMVNFITWLGYVNSSLNPVIYTIFNMDFRKAFKKILHIR